MPQQKIFDMQHIHPASLSKRALLGAGIALLLIGLFLFSIKHPNPEWPDYWMVRPLLIVPIAGAAGGAISYLLGQLLNKNNGQKTLAILLSLVIYVIGLWMGAVLGLDGTLWD